MDRGFIGFKQEKTQRNMLSFMPLQEQSGYRRFPHLQ